MSLYLKSLLFFLLLLFSACSSSEEKDILSLLDNLKTKGEIKEKINKLELLALSKKIEKYFCSSLEIQLLDMPEDRKVFNSNDIRNYFIKYKSLMESLKLSFWSPKIEIKEDSATVDLKTSALGKIPSGDGNFLEKHEISLTLKKTDGSWRVCKAVQIDNLRE